MDNNEASIIEYIWDLVMPELKNIKMKVNQRCPRVNISIARHRNEHISFWGYTSFMNSPSGDKLSIMVEVTPGLEAFHINAEIAMDDGRVISSGPNCDFIPNKSALDEWHKEFSRWIESNETLILDRVEKLA